MITNIRELVSIICTSEKLCDFTLNTTVSEFNHTPATIHTLRRGNEFGAVKSGYTSLTLLNSSVTKPFATHHPFYQVARRELGQIPPAFSKTIVPMKVKFCRVLDTCLKVLVIL